MTSKLLLAMDTSTSTASLALFDGEHVVSETTWLAGREHSTRLLIEVEVALERVGKSTADLTGLVVARGPGSFTGVRVALSVAKGMAAGLGVPAWGVGSLDAVAYSAQPSQLPVRAVVVAGRGRYATALYRGGREIEPPTLVTVDGVVELLTEPTLVIGEINTEDRRKLANDPNARVASVAAGARRAGFLAELGWQRAQAGEPGNPEALDALYLST